MKIDMNENHSHWLNITLQLRYNATYIFNHFISGTKKNLFHFE
jgi:hypothetical protein